MAHTSFFAPTLPMPEHSRPERSPRLKAELSGVALPYSTSGAAIRNHSAAAQRIAHQLRRLLKCHYPTFLAIRAAGSCMRLLGWLRSLADKVSRDPPRAILILHRRHGLNGAALVFKPTLELKNDVVSIGRSRQLPG
jgi:hypothetical protein